MNNVKYVGMDVHKSITVIVVLNELGQFESRSQIKTKGENICDFFRGISGKVEVVFEEGTHSAWLYKLLKPLVASVTVCDPRHNKLIEDGNKSDGEAAETLAHKTISFHTSRNIQSCRTLYCKAPCHNYCRRSRF
jgi:hypothetical protein